MRTTKEQRIEYRVVYIHRWTDRKGESRLGPASIMDGDSKIVADKLHPTDASKWARKLNEAYLRGRRSYDHTREPKGKPKTRTAWSNPMDPYSAPERGW